MVGWLVDLRPSTCDRPGGPRFVAAGRKARLWGVPLVSFRLGPDEAGPSRLEHRPRHSAFCIQHSAFIGVVGSFDRLIVGSFDGWGDLRPLTIDQ